MTNEESIAMLQEIRRKISASTVVYASELSKERNIATIIIEEKFGKDSGLSTKINRLVLRDARAAYPSTTGLRKFREVSMSF